MSPAEAAGTFDPTDPDFVRDPYPAFRSLRDHDPVHRSPSGAWVLTRYADVFDALGDPRLGNAPARHAVVHARNRDRYVAADVAANILPFLDPPGHTVPRRLVSRAFARHLKRSPPSFETHVARLLAPCIERGRLEVLGDFATPFSFAVMCELLGLPEEDAPRLARWTERFFYLFAPIPSGEALDELNQALAEFRAYFREAVDVRRGSEHHDLIQALVTAEEDGTRLSEEQVVDTCMLLFADGIENVDAAVANGLHALLEHPDQLARLRDRPELIGTAVDECLRFESPAQFIARIAREELTLEGATVPTGRAVLLVLGSANRDERTFEEPDRFDVGRTPNPHLAFGRGGHSCVGAVLVRREMAAALGALVRAGPRLRAPGPASWRARPAHRWLESLEVTLGD